MAKLSFIWVLSSLFIIALLPLAYSKPKQTLIRFFLHSSGGSSANITEMFGQVLGFDDPLTVDPNPNSEMMGRAQGTIAFSDRNRLALHVSVTCVFVSGKYNGSTISAVGRNNVPQKARQMPIVGGTGAFELARGIVTGSTYSTEPPIFEYNLVVIQDS